MIKLPEISTPKTLRTFRRTNGEEFVLKGLSGPIESQKDNYLINHLKLYKKTTVDGLDTFQLVGKKEEKYLVNGSKHFISIRKESYNPLTGALTEQSAIHQNVYGNKALECCGDVFKLHGSVCTNTSKNKTEAIINTTIGNLTPMAKRILKLITK